MTDGRTDRQNYDFQDRASIAASRGKNVNTYVVFEYIKHPITHFNNFTRHCNNVHQFVKFHVVLNNTSNAVFSRRVLRS